MSLYYYDVYHVATSTRYTNRRDWPGNRDISSAGAYVTTSYDFAGHRGFYSTGTSKYISEVGESGYVVSATSVTQYFIIGGGMIAIDNVEQADLSVTYSRGDFIETIKAEEGTYPDNGRVGTTFWYIKRGRTFPELAIKVDGVLKASEDGWVKIDGQLKSVEQMWVKVDGEIKEV